MWYAALWKEAQVSNTKITLKSKKNVIIVTAQNNVFYV